MKYTEDHEWLKTDDTLKDKTVTVGITAHAAEELGEIVFVELPEVGACVSKGDEVVVIESVKAASDICAPLDGEITEVNTTLTDNPALVNEDPTGAGWFFRIKLKASEDLNTLMDEAAYNAMIS